MKVWVVLSRDETMNIAVAETEELAKQAAQNDSGESTPLAWERQRDGRFVTDDYDYEVRAFDLIGREDA